MHVQEAQANISSALNHTEATNSKSYQTTIRERNVALTKIEVNKLKHAKAQDMKSVLTSSARSFILIVIHEWVFNEQQL